MTSIPFIKTNSITNGVVQQRPAARPPVKANLVERALDAAYLKNKQLQAKLDAIEAHGGEALQAALKKGRIAAILAMPEAKGRRSLATHLAHKTDFDEAAAKAALSAAPVDEAEILADEIHGSWNAIQGRRP